MNKKRKTQRYGKYYFQTMQPVWEERWQKYLKRIKILKKDIEHLGPIPKKEKQLISTVNYFVDIINLITNFSDKGLLTYLPKEKGEEVSMFNALITALVAREKHVHQYKNTSEIGKSVTRENLYLGIFSRITDSSEITPETPTIEINGRLRRVEVDFAPLSDWINHRVKAMNGRSCTISQKDLAITLSEIRTLILEYIDAVL